MLYSFSGGPGIQSGIVGLPLAHSLTRAGGLLAAAALAAVLLIIPQQSQAAAPAGHAGPVIGSAQLVQNIVAADAAAFVVTKGQKG